MCSCVSFRFVCATTTAIARYYLSFTFVITSELQLLYIYETLCFSYIFLLFICNSHLHFDDCMNTTCRVTAAVFVCVLCRVSRASFPPFASASSRSPRCSRASLVAFVWLACSSSRGWLAVSPMPANAGFITSCSLHKQAYEILV